jgi:hypothetical protein
VDIPNASKGSARGNAASNGKRNFHKRKNEWDGLKKWIAERARQTKKRKGLPQR